MSKYFSLFAIFIFAVFLSSCETDFNPNAEYKDITVVYGILNQSDTFTYLKINKAFLGDASAYVMAQNEDLSKYTDSLEIKMDELVNDNPVASFSFDTTTVYNKEAGIFYAPKQVLYRCYTLNMLKEGRVYRLTIKNKNTGKIISSKTQLVNKFDITRPSSGQSMIEFILPTATITGKSKVEWMSAAGGKRYQVNMRINYYESLNDTSHYQLKHIDINLGTQKRTTMEGSTEMDIEYFGISFYESLKNNLAHNKPQPALPDYYRKTGKIEFIISVAADDLSTYIDVNEASNSIVQIRPEYTNITNGIGVFSARYNNMIDKPRRMDLGPNSLAVLRSGQYAMLGF